MTIVTMMLTASVYPYIAIALLVALSAFFSASEIVYASANRLRLKNEAEDGNKAAKVGVFITDNYQRTLSSILVGNNLVNIASSSVATVLALELSGESSAFYVTLIMTVIILIFGEIIPKNIGLEHSEKLAKSFAYPLRAYMAVAKPVVIPVLGMINGLSEKWKDESESDQTMTDDELVTMIEMVEDEGVIDEDRSELLQSAIEFSDVTVQEIITPRVDMLAIDIDDSFDEIHAIIDSSAHSRLPVYEDSIDNIIGVLYLNTFYRRLLDEPSFDIRDILMDVCYLPKTLKLPYALNEIRRRKQHLAVVTDEYGGTLGIVTIEDILEQLVGEIWDETDTVVSEFTENEDGTFDISGDMSIYELLDELDINENSFDGDYTTAGGWITDMLNKFPEVGETVEFMGYLFTVTRMEGHRVISVKAEKVPAEDDDKENE